jgi:hypothetical protein
MGDGRPNYQALRLAALAQWVGIELLPTLLPPPFGIVPCTPRLGLAPTGV